MRRASHVITRPRPAPAGVLRCTASTNLIAQDTRARYEQRCTQPVGHEGVHIYEWEEIAVEDD